MGKDEESDEGTRSAAEGNDEKTDKKKNVKKGKKDKKKKTKDEGGTGDEDDEKNKEKAEAKPKEADEGIDVDDDGTAEKTVAKTDRSTLSDKKQDFQMRIKVICGRQLAGSNIKPIVKVKIGKGQVKTTRCRKGSSPIWNELIVFNMNESLKDVYDFIIEFTVNNSRKLRSDSLIGSFKLDLGSVYDQPEHAYVRKWLLLTDLEDTSNSPTGYLKVTICILGPGNQPPEDKSDDDDDDVEGNLLTPAGAALKTSNFCLRVYSAEDLPQMSGLGFKGLKKLGGSAESSSEASKKSVNPYFTLGFAGKKRKTKKAKETNSPEWNVELNLPFKFPSMCDGIKLCMKNKVKLGHDDVIGTAMMLLSAISSTGDGSGSDEGFLPTFGPTFVNFYGSPREYERKDDALEPLNTGKGEGCAYRGRVMMELVTSLEEEDGESVSPRQEIGEEALEAVKKYYRRRRYRLVVGFESASMIEKNYEDLEFEISMGNYGNKFDVDSKSACSVTEPTRTTFDDCKYYYVPWTTKKPILMLTSQWEETNFRFFAVNLITWICDKISTETANIRRQIRNKHPEPDVAASLVELLDVIILETSKRLPNPKNQMTSNELDSLLYEQRTKVLEEVAGDAKALRQECTDAAHALDSIGQFSEKLQAVAYEPQNNIPDIIVWMVSGKKRIAYHRIPAQDVIYSSTDPHFSGKFCSKPQSIFLKTPNAKPSSKKRYQYPCQVRLAAWLGLAKEQDGFDLNTDGKITVCAETYEVESKIPLKGWAADGFKDKSGEIPLSKESFTCPDGWQWEDDWELSSELHLLRDSGHSSFMEECFVHESRFAELDWEPEKVVNSAGKIVDAAESILCPKGWMWEDSWKVDTDRACDEDGWEYTIPSDDQGTTAWSSMEKDFHLLRRKRMIRYRKLVDRKILKKEAKKEMKMEELWEYSTSMSGKFHLESKAFDMVRRRKWIRRMVTSGTQTDSAIFSLDKSVVKSWSFLESLKVSSVLGASTSKDQHEPSGSSLVTTDVVAADPSITDIKDQIEELEEDVIQEDTASTEETSQTGDNTGERVSEQTSGGSIEEHTEDSERKEVIIDQSASAPTIETQISSSEEYPVTLRSTKSEPFNVPLRTANQDVDLEDHGETSVDIEATKNREEKSKSVDLGELPLLMETPATDEVPEVPEPSLSSGEDQKYRDVATKKDEAVHIAQKEKKKLLEGRFKLKTFLSPIHTKKSKKAEKRDTDTEAKTDDEKSSDVATIDGSAGAIDEPAVGFSTPSQHFQLPDASARDKSLSAESDDKSDKLLELPPKPDKPDTEGKEAVHIAQKEKKKLLEGRFKFKTFLSPIHTKKSKKAEKRDTDTEAKTDDEKSSDVATIDEPAEAIDEPAVGSSTPSQHLPLPDVSASDKSPSAETDDKSDKLSELPPKPDKPDTDVDVEDHGETSIDIEATKNREEKSKSVDLGELPLLMEIPATDAASEVPERSLSSWEDQKYKDVVTKKDEDKEGVHIAQKEKKKVLEGKFKFKTFLSPIHTKKSKKAEKRDTDIEAKTDDEMGKSSDVATIDGPAEAIDEPAVGSSTPSQHLPLPDVSASDKSPSAESDDKSDKLSELPPNLDKPDTEGKEAVHIAQKEKKKLLEGRFKFKTFLSPIHTKKSKKAEKRDTDTEAKTDDEKSSDVATIDGSAEAIDEPAVGSSTPSQHLPLPDVSASDKSPSAESDDKSDKLSELPPKPDTDVDLEDHGETSVDIEATKNREEKSKNVDLGKLPLLMETPATDAASEVHERSLSSGEDQKYRDVGTKKDEDNEAVHIAQKEKKKVLEGKVKFKTFLSPIHTKKSKKAEKRDTDTEAKTDDEMVKSSDVATIDGPAEAIDEPAVGSSTPSQHLPLPDVSASDKSPSAETDDKSDKLSELPPKPDKPVTDTNMDTAVQKKRKPSTAFLKAARKTKNKLSGPKIYLIFENAYKFQLRAYIYQGRDLLPMAKNNFSDPVIFVSFLNNCRRSIVVNHTLNPIWDQTLIMDITLYGDLRLLQEYCSDVVLEIFHANEAKKISITPFKSKPKKSSKPIKGDLKLMGRSFGKPAIKLCGDTEEKARLEWLDVSKGNSDGGCILAAFDLFMKDESQDFPVLPPRHTNQKYNDLYIVPYGIRPVLQRTAVEILVWGVRNMQPFKILNVDTPLVLIQIGEVEIRTKPLKNAKKHPNYPQPFHLVIANLPVEEIYFPPIVIRVKDNRKFGRRPTVGQHVITDVTKYRREPLEPKLTFSDNDDGFEDKISLDDNQSVSIEMEKPTKPIEPAEKATTMFDRLKQVAKLPTLLKNEESASEEAQDIDWWSKYYASVGDKDKSGDFEKSGLCHIKVYKNELEKQENFDNFSDYIETFDLSRGKSKEDEDPEFAGEFKGAFRIYRLPEDPNKPMPPPFCEAPFHNESQEVIVRVYVVRGIDLAAQNSNGLADPYIKIKSGKRRIEDKKNYIPNTLNPTFGRMFELEVKLPIQKDLFVQVYDWNLIGTDDKIGETVIDLENRFYSKFKAWCGLPEVYETSGPTPWRDQMTPKEMLYETARKEGWDEPVWNGNICVSVNRKRYQLDQFELNMKPSPYWGEAEERLCLHVLRSFPYVPEHVETRPIFSKQMPGIEQGRLQLWVDMFPKDLGPPGLPFDISPRKPSKYFLRVIIWNCSDIPMVSTSFSGDKMTDIYLKGWMTGLEYKRQKTDVHYRSMDGTGNFNWRFIFPFDYIPQEKLVHVSKKRHVWSMDKTVTKFPPVLTVQVWNNDLFKPNDYLSEVTLPLLNMAKCCKFKRSCTIDNVPDFQGNCKMEMVSLFEQKLLKGWWPLYKVVDGKKEQSGKLEMSVEVVTEVEHEERPAAKARNEPNLNPKLDKPKRPATSFAWFSNPLKSLRYIIWRKYKWYIIAILILLPIVAFIVLMFYNLPNAVLRLL